MQFPNDFIPYTDYDPQEFISKPPKIVFETNNAILQLVAAAFESVEVFVQIHTWKIKAHSTPITDLIFLKLVAYKFITCYKKTGEVKLWNLNKKMSQKFLL